MAGRPVGGAASVPYQRIGRTAGPVRGTACRSERGRHHGRPHPVTQRRVLPPPRLGPRRRCGDVRRVTASAHVDSAAPGLRPRVAKEVAMSLSAAVPAPQPVPAPAPIPLRELLPWAVFGLLLAFVAIYLVGAEQGA